MSTLARFLCVGASATAIQYLLLLALAGWLGVIPVLASTVAYVASALYHYMLSHAIAFRSGRAHGSALPRFAIVVLVGLVLNAAVFWLAVDQLHLHYLAAQLMATIVTLNWNYVASLRWAFAS